MAASLSCALCGAANPPQATACFSCGQALQAAAGFAASVLLKQRYRLLRQVGKGGFGAVYQARDNQLADRLVAVKEMSQRGLSPQELQEATEAFQREGSLLAHLKHPSLPVIHDYFNEAGRWYLVMEFIEGETLEDRLSKAPGGHLALSVVIQLGLQLCAVLEYLHTRQPPVIFRDLKPSNIMLTADEQVYLIDFGIARLFKPGQTKDTVAFGSPGYAAPEQYGKAQTTAQSDIFSLGAVLHHLLSGSDPSNTPFLFAPLHLASPAGLERLIMQMVKLPMNARPASMAAIRQALQRIANGNAAVQRATTPPLISFSRQPSTPVLRTAPAQTGAQAGTAYPQPLPLIRVAPAVRGRRAFKRSVGSAGTPLFTCYGHSERINAVAWSPDGRLIASGAFDYKVRVWDAVNGQSLYTYPGHAGYVYAVAWSPDGRRIASGSADKTAQVWDALTGGQVVTYGGHSNWVLAVVWSPDGRHIASGSYDETVRVWQASAGQPVFTYYGHSGVVRALAWSPDEKYIASASNDGTVQVSAGGSKVFTYYGHSDRAHAVAWSPDGKRIASAGADNTVQVWNTITGSAVCIYRGHTKLVNTVAWSPDGKRIASGSEDKTAQVWDAASGDHAFIYRGHSDAVWSVVWSPDGRRIVSGSSDKTVQVWQAG